jgi:outer membrane protein
VRAAIRPFDGGVAAARVRAARAGVDASTHAESQVRAALELEIVTRYADAQLHRQLRDIADSAHRQAERTLALTRQAVEQGRTAEFEVWRVEAEVAALRPATLDAARNVRLAERALRQSLDLPEDIVLLLDAPPVSWSSDTLARDTLAVALRARATDRQHARLGIREFEAREREAAASHQAAWRALLPVVDVTLTHQRLAYPIRNANWGGPYFPNTALGVSFTLPLDLTGGSLTRLESAAAAVRLAKAQRRDAERVHALEQLDTQAQLDATRLEWEAAVAGVASADKALQVADARHAVGRASLLELQDARVTWMRAMATRARAARDRMVIDARTARFDRLPISTVQP